MAIATGTAAIIASVIGAGVAGGVASRQHDDAHQAREDSINAADAAKAEQAKVDQRLNSERAATEQRTNRDLSYLAARRNMKRIAQAGSQAPGALPIGSQPPAGGKTAIGQ